MAKGQKVLYIGCLRPAQNCANIRNGESLCFLDDVCNMLDLIPSKVAQRLSDDVLSKYPIVDNTPLRLKEDGVTAIKVMDSMNRQ